MTGFLSDCSARISQRKKKSENDIEKADLVRSSSLKYWSTLLPYKECLYYIESTPCHFNKLTLRVYGTKLTDGRLIHYEVFKY
jgi:hypothetical protein